MTLEQIGHDWIRAAAGTSGKRTTSACGSPSR
jgi:hypothetical protein